MRQGVSKEYLKGTRRHRSTCFPIHNFLTSRLGLPWDEVYSELSAEFDKRTLAGYEFFRDIQWMVETHCWIEAETGKLYDKLDREISADYYVHPHTGLLSYAPKRIREYPARPVTKLQISYMEYFEKLEGIWYYINYKELPVLPYYGLWQRHAPYFTMLSKRQLNKKELKKLGLRNGPADIQKEGR